MYEDVNDFMTVQLNSEVKNQLLQSAGMDEQAFLAELINGYYNRINNINNTVSPPVGSPASSQKKIWGLFRDTPENRTWVKAIGGLIIALMVFSIVYVAWKENK